MNAPTLPLTGTHPTGVVKRVEQLHLTNVLIAAQICHYNKSKKLDLS